jgi:hypothetical protein
VDWLIERYQPHDIVASCWYRHGAMVSELDSLHAAWQAAYLDPAGRPLTPPSGTTCCNERSSGYVTGIASDASAAPTATTSPHHPVT